MKSKNKVSINIGSRLDEFRGCFDRSPSGFCVIKSSVNSSGELAGSTLVYANDAMSSIEGLGDCNYELNKIGNNINQLTVLCHQRRIDNPDLHGIHGRLCAVLDSIVDRLGGGEDDSNRQAD